MRLSRTDLKRRINGQLALRFESSGLTSFAGLELFRGYLLQVGVVEHLRDWATRWLPKSDYGAASMVLLLLTLLVTGGRRIRHLEHLQLDPVVKRACGLSRLPSAQTMSRWLSSIDGYGVEALLRVNDRLVGGVMNERQLARLTVDVDGTVVSTGLQVEHARRGFNPHRRKVPSYYPITAYEANTGQLLRVRNRAGNVHDGKACYGFLRELFEQFDATVERRPVVEMRMDGAFFREEIITLLESERVEYAKVPLYPWLELKQHIAHRRRWHPVDGAVECFELRKRITPWARTQRIVVYRKRVHHRTAKNFQLDLFDPDDGYYEYSAVTTNKTISGRTLWFFMCGRGCHEKVYAELKGGFAFNSVASRRFEANSAWQVLSVMAFNLTRGFQAATTAAPRSGNRKRRTHHRFEHIRTLRYRFLSRAGLLVRPGGKATLDVGNNQSVRRRFEAVAHRLAIAA